MSEHFESLAKPGNRKVWLYVSAILVAFLLWTVAFVAGTQAAIPAGPMHLASTFGDAESIRNDTHITSAMGPSSPLTCPPDYEITQAGGATLVPGSELVTGSRCDDCVVNLALPFTYNLYGAPYTTAKVTSNGYILFTGQNQVFANTCLPYNPFNNALMPYWDDLRMDANAGDGIFTSVSGSAPNRIFNVEWRGTFFVNPNTVNFEVRLYEGQDRFDIVYGQVYNSGSGATVGVQRNSSQYTQFSCNSSTLTNGMSLSFVLPTSTCLTPTPTGTSVATPIPTATPPGIATPTLTPIVLGHVTWDGRPQPPNPEQELPISLTLRLVTGGPYIDFPLQNTDASGYFTESIAGVPSGSYYWRAWGPYFLANSGTIEISGAPVTELEVGLLRAGDANEDNHVDIRDFVIHRVAYNMACGYPNYEERADFNGDCVINARDFSLLRKNFGMRGAPPLGSE